jgi:hypothetical protein
MSYVTRLLDSSGTKLSSPWSRTIYVQTNAPPRGLGFLERIVAYWITLAVCTVLFWGTVFAAIARLYLALEGSMWPVGSSGAAVCLLQYFAALLDPGAPDPPSLLFGLREYIHSAHFSALRFYISPLTLWFILTVLALLYLVHQDNWIVSSFVFLLYGFGRMAIRWSPALHSTWKQTLGWPLQVTWIFLCSLALATLSVYFTQILASEQWQWYLSLGLFLPATQLLFLHWRWVTHVDIVSSPSTVCDTCAMLRVRLDASVLFLLLSAPHLFALLSFLLWHILCQCLLCALARLPSSCSWATLETGSLTSTGFPLVLMLAMTRRFSQPYDWNFLDVAAQSVCLLLTQLIQGAVVCFLFGDSRLVTQRSWGQWWGQVRVATSMALVFSAASYSEFGLNFYSQ